MNCRVARDYLRLGHVTFSSGFLKILGRILGDLGLTVSREVRAKFRIRWLCRFQDWRFMLRDRIFGMWLLGALDRFRDHEVSLS